MAYVDVFEKDRQAKKLQSQTSGEQGVTSSGGSSGGGIASSTAATSAGPASTAPKSQGEGSGFVNINKYMDANAGQSERMADDVVGKSQDIGNSIGSQAGSYANKVGGQIQSGAKTADSSILNAPNAINKDQFKSFWNASYEGPQSDKIASGDDDSMAINKALDTLSQRASNTGKFEGRQQLLNDSYNDKDRYAKGESTFDALLLGSQPKLNEIKNVYGSAKEGWDKTSSKLRSDADLAKKATDESRGRFQTEFKNKFGGLEGDIASAESNLIVSNEARQAAYSRALDKLSRGDTSDISGIDSSTVNRILSKGYDPAKLLKDNGRQSLGDVVDGNKSAQYQALQALSGITGLGGKTFQGINDKTGLKSDAAAFNTNQGQIEAAKQYADIMGRLEGNVSSLKSKKDDSALALALGISPDDVAEARSLGIDLNKYADKAGIGDFASNDDASALSSLMQSLGIDGVDLEDKAKYDINSLRDYKKALGATKEDGLPADFPNPTGDPMIEYLKSFNNTENVAARKGGQATGQLAIPATAGLATLFDDSQAAQEKRKQAAAKFAPASDEPVFSSPAGAATGHIAIPTTPRTAATPAPKPAAKKTPAKKVEATAKAAGKSVSNAAKSAGSNISKKFKKLF